MPRAKLLRKAGTYAALAPKTDRAVLGVGGASFTFLMFRSRYFATFLTLLESFLETPLPGTYATLPTVPTRGTREYANSKPA